MFMIRRNPFSNFDLRFISPHLDVDLFENNTHTSSEKVINNANEWKVLLTVPGVDPSELDISVENNMPFFYQKQAFIFNGELRGVRVKSDGRIGAEKLFHFIKRFDRGDLLEAMNRSIPVIHKRSQSIRGMNIIMGDGQRIYLNSFFSEDGEYFTMHYRREKGTLIVCSEPYPGQDDWLKIKNHTMEVME